VRVQNKSLFIYSVTFFIAACFASTLALQGEPRKNPCKADVEKFCKDVEPGEGRIVKCLQAHRQDLSGACKAVNEKAGAAKAKKEKAGGKFEQACGDDVEKFCSEIESGGGRVMGCLRKNSDKLSASCKALWKGKGPAGLPPGKEGGPKGDKDSE